MAAAVGAPVAKYEKSYFDVLGICCPSEVPLVEKLLEPLAGVHKVTVVVPSRTVIVVHDTDTISQFQIVRALNQARLEASVRAYGSGTDNEKISNKWPSPYVVACGVLLTVSLFQHFWHPLKWFALAGAAVGLPPIILRSIAAARRLTLDVNILMLIAVAGTIALKDYSEAGFIVFLFTTAEWLETRASRKATAGMSSLMSMAPQNAVLEETGEVMATKDVKVNTIITVKAGEVIPIDGVVVNGRSEVDESTLTGESFPVGKQADSLVWAGTLNIDGYIAVRTTAMADNSAVAKMARLVEEAQNSRSSTQRLIDTCAKYYTPAVVVMAAAVAVIPVIAKAHNLKHWFQLALVLLVSACPCALVLSTPVATFCALLRAAKTGLLIKGGDVLETLASIKVAAFDKTGTITRGEFSVKEFNAVSERVPKKQLLYWVSSIESRSSHPMASALVGYAQSNSVEAKSEKVTEFQIFPGEGIYGEIDGEGVYVGNKRILSRASYQTVPDMEDMKGVTVGYVACKKELIGVFTLSDSCRTGSAEAIKQLRSLGIKSVMLTGDSNAAATYADNQLGNILAEVHSELLPEDKVRIVDELKAKYGPALMIGDGMNDAPALAKADVGVSMGVSGSAVAMETSHITLMSNDIRRIPKAIELARRTHRTIIVNIVFSVATKLAIVGLAFSGHPLIWAAVLADVGTCLLVIMYSMLLLREKDRHTHSSHHRAHSKEHNSSHHISDGLCHDHHHDHNHSEVPSNMHSPDKHSCHDHSHGHNHCKEQNNQLVTSKHVSHDHDHAHNICKKPSNTNFINRHDCHGHEHSHCGEPKGHVSHSMCKEPSNTQSTNKHDCHGHEHSHCEELSGHVSHNICKEQINTHSTNKHDCHGHEHSHCEEPSGHVSHNICKEPSNTHSTNKHDCHGHEHSHCEEPSGHVSHNICKEPSNTHSTNKYDCHGHEHSHCEEPRGHVSHNICKEPSNTNLINKHDSHGHEHIHCEESSGSHAAKEVACHGHEHIHCEELNSSYSIDKHACHDHKHCEQPISLHCASEQACHDQDQGHHCCDEQKISHTEDKHSCHDHKQGDGTTDSIQEILISIDGPSSDHHEHQSQFGHHREGHKEEDCGHHPKVKGCVPAPTNCNSSSSKNCCSTVSSKGCENKGKDNCSSWQVGRTRGAIRRRCCRSYVRCSRAHSCCSHSILKLPEIVVE